MTATAYFYPKGRKVKVIEDPTYKTASFPLSLGGLEDNFSKRKYFARKFVREFIFQIPELLKTKKILILQPAW